MFGSCCSLQVLSARHGRKAVDPVSNQVTTRGGDRGLSIARSLVGHTRSARRGVGERARDLLKEKAVLRIARNDVGHRGVTYGDMAIAGDAAGVFVHEATRVLEPLERRSDPADTRLVVERVSEV